MTDGRDVEGIEVTVATCSICAAGVDCVGIGVADGVVCGNHAIFAVTNAGSTSESDDDNLILITVIGEGGKIALRSST